jgi:AraC-like DNA-binding protein
MKINIINFGIKASAPEFIRESGDYLCILFRTEAEVQIKGINRNIPPESVIILNPGTSVSCRTPVFFDSISFRMNTSEQQYFHGLDIPADIVHELTDNIIIQSIIKCMHSQSLNPGSMSSDFNDYGLRMILISISQQLHAHTTTKERDIPRYRELLSLRRRIYSNPSESWSIEKICVSMNISRTYFHRIYFSAFGVTCTQDVIESRMTSASELLISSNMSIGSIAEQCGYDSECYFMRQFKKHMGLTPTEYRRKFSGESAVFP